MLWKRTERGCRRAWCRRSCGMHQYAGWSAGASGGTNSRWTPRSQRMLSGGCRPTSSPRGRRSIPASGPRWAGCRKFWGAAGTISIKKAILNRQNQNKKLKIKKPRLETLNTLTKLEFSIGVSDQSPPKTNALGSTLKWKIYDVLDVPRNATTIGKLGAASALGPVHLLGHHTLLVPATHGQKKRI